MCRIAGRQRAAGVSLRGAVGEIPALANGIDFSDFVTGYMMERANDLESQKEAYNRMTLLNYMAGIYDMSSVMNGSVVDLTSEFNTEFGTSYTRDDLLSTYLKEFMEFFTAKVKIDSDRMTNEILIGLNDLHLQYKLKFLFELLANGKIDELMNKMVAKGLPCGFGGIASLDKGMISGRNILAEHYRLHSSMAILSRSFCDTSKIKDEDEIENIFHQGIIDIRDFEESLTKQNEEYFELNHQEVIRKTNEIIDIISKK